MALRFRFASLSLRFAASAVVLCAGLASSHAQTNQPIVLPNTYSTAAGGGAATTAATPCVTGSRFNATDIYGNGCPATQSRLGYDLHGGVALDGQGNLFINDSNNTVSGSSVQMLRKVDAKSGIITSVLNSSVTACAAGTTSTLGSNDNVGDGCPFATSKYAKERGIATDPYGNVLISGYGGNVLRIVCNAVSPLCPVAAGASQTFSTALKQVGYTYRLAGCTPTGPTANPTNQTVGTSAGTAGDGYIASPFWNLPGDVTAWTANGSPAGFTVTSGTNITGEGTGGTCPSAAAGSTVGGLNGPRAVAADQYGNVYIHDGANLRIRVVVGPAIFTLPNGTVLTNPIPAIIKLNATYSGFTAAQMYGRVFPILGGYAASTAGAACANASFTAKDIYGDNCPWYNTNQTGGGNPSAVTISASGDIVEMESALKLLRVLYVGPTVLTSTLTSSSVNPMAYAIFKNNNSLTSITQGNVYVLAGGGATGIGLTPTLGTSTIMATAANRIVTTPNGNFYIGAGNNSTASSVLFYDLTTGYVRTMLSSSGATSAANITPVGSGSAVTIFYCPTPGTGDGQAAFTSSGATTNGCFQQNGTASGSLGVAADAQNNLYIADSELSVDGQTDLSRVRKVLATQLYPTTLGASTSQILRIHNPNGVTAGTSTTSATLLNAPTGISIAAPTCAAANATDGTNDCFSTVTVAPNAPGIRASTLVLTPTGGTLAPGAFPLYGIGNGSGLVADPNANGTAAGVTASTSNVAAAIAAGATPVGIALDSAGDVFTMDTNAGKFTEISAAGTVTQLPGTLPSNPTQISIDTAGNLYAVGTGNSTITKLTLGTSGSYAASTFSVAGIAAPQAITADIYNNLFIADATTSSVYEVSAGALATYGAEGLQPITTVATGLTNPTSLAVDGYGNVYIGDPGAGGIYKVNAVTGAKSSIASVSNAAYVAADTAGNVYYQDGSAKTVVEIPVSGPTTVSILSGLTTPSGLAVAGSGNIYSVDKGFTTPAVSGTVTQVARNAFSFNFGTVAFGTSGVPTVGLTLTNVGNQSATGYAETDSSEFPVTTGGSNGCGTIPSVSNALANGTACNVTATFQPANGTSAVSGVTSLLPTSTTGAFTLAGTESGSAAQTTTTSVSGPASALYLATGTEATFTINVTAQDSASLTGGTVNVSIDGGATTPYTITSNAASVPVSGLKVGAHTILATFPAQAISTVSYGNSTSAPATSFSITQASTSVSWSPGTLTQQFSAPLGNSVLNATVTTPGGATVAGAFVYTAGGLEVHAASYLARGTYVLGVTFYPNDSTDYATSTSSVTGYTVTQATTTAGIGATQTVVGPSGANFTSIQAAINSLSATAGGSVYILPGTYTGTFAVVAPNVAMRGLGGDPTAITLTHSFGAYSPGTGPSGYAGEFQATGENPIVQTAGGTAAGNIGSATLVVARGGVAGYNGTTSSALTQTIPTGFYAENISLENTYNFATTTTTTYQATANGTCVAGNATPQTYAFLYNNSQQCASQALAIYLASDQSVLNNVYFNSGQDTIYNGSGSGSNSGSANVFRQYFFRGKVTGNIDYIFGDAAAVFDRTTIYTTYHRNQTGNATVGAQNKAQATGSGGDYLSGYIFNSAVFTTQSSGMTAAYFARPYGVYSTQIALNSAIDQVNNLGYEEFSGQTNLPTSTFGEYNNSAYADPATGSPDINGVTYLGTGGSTGTGATATRETVSNNPGTLQVANLGFQTNYPSLANTTLSAAEAQQYYPLAFLGKTTTATVTNWDPTAAIATKANAFVAGGVATVGYGQSVTILMRPQTPGLGAVTNGNYTIPTGTFSLSDGATVLASGTLDAAGQAYFTTTTLASGAHSLTWTYGGDANFAGSTTASPYTLTVGAVPTTTTLSPATQTITYGQSASVTVTVAATSSTYTPTGNVTLSIDGGASTQTLSLSGGTVTFSVNGLTAGAHTFSASYLGDEQAATSTSTSSVSATVNKATLTVTGVGTNRAYDTPNVISPSVSGYQYTDSAATVFATGPSVSTTAVQNSPAGTYNVVPTGTLSTFGNNNYTLSLVTGTFTVTGGAPQSITFAALPNFPAGSFQLTARTTSGLPVAYSVTGGGGIASVSGSTLTVTGTGTVTIQATTPADPTGDYAAATPVSRSFTAQ